MKNSIINTIAIENPRDWEFIVKMLDKEFIENAAVDYGEPSSRNVFTELGVEFKEELRHKPWENCLGFLMRQATKKMWQEITKEQVNNLLGSMYAVNAVNITMPNGVGYTANDIIKDWEQANKEVSNDGE